MLPPHFSHFSFWYLSRANTVWIKIVIYPWSNWCEGFRRRGYPVTYKWSEPSVVCTFRSRLKCPTLLFGSYFNCDPAEDSSVCFVERRMSKLTRRFKRWTLKSSLKASLSRTNLQVVFASPDRDRYFNASSLDANPSCSTLSWFRVAWRAFYSSSVLGWLLFDIFSF